MSSVAHSETRSSAHDQPFAFQAGATPVEKRHELSLSSGWRGKWQVVLISSIRAHYTLCPSKWGYELPRPFPGQQTNRQNFGAQGFRCALVCICNYVLTP